MPVMRGSWGRWIQAWLRRPGGARGSWPLRLEALILQRYRRRLTEWNSIQTARMAYRARGSQVYLDPAQPLEVRVEDLLRRMTLEEKIEQMSGPPSRFGKFRAFFRAFTAFFIPIVLSRNARLGIPPFIITGSSHGATYFGTAFPCAMARGASWDTDLERRVHAAIAAEAHGLGANVLTALCINLLRHPGWGRAQETYGEDTYHVSRMAVAAVRGAQAHLIAQPKHFALNSIERDRFRIDVRVSERTLREVYLPQFEAVVKEAGAGSVMSAYNRVNGEYCAENRHLLRDILKGDWAFDGVVMSDWVFGTHSTIDAAASGLDIEMPTPIYYGKRLLTAVRQGSVSESNIDDAVRRCLRTKLRFGLLENHPAVELSVVRTDEHRALAREAAAKSLVLLKNDAGALPLARDVVRRLAVIGRFANKPRLGDIGSSALSRSGAVSIGAGIRAAAPGLNVSTSNGHRLGAAARLARNSDAVVVVASLTPHDEGEWLGPTPFGGDREHLGLSKHDARLIQAVAAANPRTVVVVQAGGAVTMSEWIDSVPAILLAWYPGCEGGHAIAEALFGTVNPSGKLPFTIPADESQLCQFGTGKPTAHYGYLHGYRYFDRAGLAPQFPFGFGLSYTRYSYANIAISPDAITADGSLQVEFDVANEGPRAGDEIAQLYLSRPGVVEFAPRDLRGFAKVHLEPGEATRVSLPLTWRDLAYLDETKGRWCVASGRYTVQVGPNSRDLPLEARFEVLSERCSLR